MSGGGLKRDLYYCGPTLSRIGDLKSHIVKITAAALITYLVNYDPIHTAGVDSNVDSAAMFKFTSRVKNNELYLKSQLRFF